MAASQPGELKAEPNLTPLLDLVFQLITFFMLLINFGKDEFNAQIKLPLAASARPAEQDNDTERLVIHVDKDGRLLVRKDQGGDRPFEYERALRYLDEQAGIIRAAALLRGQDIKPGEPLPATLVIRADKDCPFDLLHRIITACQRQGFTDYALKALPVPGR